MKHGSCETVSLGELPIVHGSVSQMVETEERLDGLDGILIKCEEKVLYAAVWEPVKVNFTGCVRRESQKEEIAEKPSEENDAEAEESFAEEVCWNRRLPRSSVRVQGDRQTMRSAVERNVCNAGKFGE